MGDALRFDTTTAKVLHARWPHEKKRTLLSVIIPAYNEQETIQTILHRVLSIDLSALGVDKEVIVVNDGSRDETARLARQVPGVIVIEHERNSGKGAAVRTGIEHSAGDIVLVQDADLEYDPEEYSRLLEPMVDGQADVVYGSRILGARLRQQGRRRLLNKHDRAYLMAFLGGRVITIATNLLYRTDITDEPTCYKCFRRSVLKKVTIENTRFDWEPEVTAKIAKLGIRIHEVPISYHPRSYSEGKKIGWRDAVAALWTLARLRFTRDDAAR